VLRCLAQEPELFARLLAAHFGRVFTQIPCVYKSAPRLAIADRRERSERKMNWSRSRLARCPNFLVGAPVMLAVLSALRSMPRSRPRLARLFSGSIQRQSKIHWTLESTVHTVHGSFAFKKGSCGWIRRPERPAENRGGCNDRK